MMYIFVLLLKGSGVIPLTPLRLASMKPILLGGLRLPLNAFTTELLFRLGIAPNQINPNGLRIIVTMQVLWREVFERNCPLTIDKFLYCYKPFEISQFIGFY